MAKATLGAVLQFLHKTYPPHQARDRTDRELLDRFVRLGEEAAFTTLVERHGPLVQGVCRRILGDYHSAEDAFQATFIVLARKARSLTLTSSLSTWLHAVARRIALRAKAQATSRHDRERRSATMPHSEPVDGPTWEELRGILDEEIGRLAEKYRAPLLLCYFEGKSRRQAAQELGIPEGTVARRLSRGRELLGQQLVRRGVALSAGMLGVVLSEKVTAAPVAALLTLKTARAAAGLLSGKLGAAAYLSTRALGLAEEAMTGMYWLKGKAILVLLASILVAVSGGWAGYRMLDSSSQAAPAHQSQAPASQPPGAQAAKPRVDHYGDPLPPGAINRIGSARFRHAGGVTGMLYTSDGKAIISISTDHALRRWDATTGKLRWRSPRNDSYVSAMAMSPDGKRLALLSASEYDLVDVATGASLLHLPWPLASDDAAGSGAIAPDLSMFVRGCRDGTLRIYDAGGEEKRRITVGDKAQGQVPLKVELLSDAKTVYVDVSDTPGIRAYDIATGKLIRVVSEETGWLVGLHLSQDGRQLAQVFRAQGGKPDRVVLWDLTAGKQRHAIEHVFPAPITGAFSPDGALFAVGSQGQDIVVFDTASGKEHRRLAWHPSTLSLAFAPDGKTLASGDGEGSIALWSMETGKRILSVPEQAPDLGRIRFMNDGRRMLALGGDGNSLWDVTSGRLLKWLPRETASYGLREVSPDGKQLVAAMLNGDMNLIDIATGRALRTFKGHSRWPYKVSFSSDGTKLFSAGGFDPRVIVWDATTGKMLRELKSHAVCVQNVVVSPDGRWLASATRGAVARGGPDYDIRIWELATGKLLYRLTPRRGSAFAMVFSLDSSQLVSVGGEPGRLNNSGEVQLWDVASGKEVRSFVGHQDRVSCAALTPDGRMLATGSVDKTLRLWEVANGLERGRISGHEGQVHSLDFAPDGRVLAAASADAPVYLWDAYRTPVAGSAGKLSREGGDRLWQNLASMDGPTSFQALCTLIAHPAEAPSLLQDGWKGTALVTAEQVRQWLGDLASRQFATRKRATAQLERFQTGHEDLLQKALAEAGDLEMRQRLQQILRFPNPERLRRTRVLEVLEHINNEAARSALETLASDTADPSGAAQAAAGLKRLRERDTSRRTAAE